MGIKIAFPESVDPRIIREGNKLCNEPSFAPKSSRSPSGSELTVTAVFKDAFNFVDRAQIQLDSAGERLLNFRCNCPDFRISKGFCPHCAALAIAFQEDLHAIRTSILSRESKQPSLIDFRYAFTNNAKDLYPGVTAPRIPLERYIQAFGNTAKAHSLFSASKNWHGSCYGIVAASGMFRQPDSGVRICDFNKNACIPEQLRLTDHNRQLGMTLHTHIELLHVLQMAPSVIQGKSRYLKDSSCLDTLVKRVEAFQAGQAAPVLLLVYQNPKLQGGHAVLPYLVEHVSSTQERLHLYDPNYPNETRYFHVTKDERGNRLHWTFTMNSKTLYESEHNARLSLAPYELFSAAWNNRGSHSPENLLKVASDMTVKDEAGNVLLRVTEDAAESFRDDFLQITTTEGPGTSPAAFYIPADTFVFCQENPRLKELDISLSGTRKAVSLTTEAREAVLQLEDAKAAAACRITQPRSRFAIQFLTLSGDTQETACLQGITGSRELYLIQENGSLYARGLPEQAVFSVNNKPQPLNRILPLPEEAEETEETTQRISDSEPRSEIELCINEMN